MRYLVILALGAMLMGAADTATAMDKEAMAKAYQEAEQIRKSSKSEADLTRALEMQQDLYAKGNRNSLLRIGQLQLALNQGEAAYDSFKKASEAGSGYARHLLAVHHARGDFGSKSNPELGMNALKTMSEGSDGMRAKLALAELYDQGIGGTTADANQIFAALAAEGHTRAASFVLRKHEKSSTRIRGADIVAIVNALEKQVDEGNPQAASILARAYLRNARYIPNARARHAALVENHLEMLPAKNRMAEVVSATYDYKNHAGSARRLSAELESATGDEFVQAALRLRGIEKTAFVYLMQKELAALDAFNGRPTGKLTNRTIQSMFAYCRKNGIYDTCKHGPITYDSSLLIARAIGAEKQQRLTQ